MAVKEDVKAATVPLLTEGEDLNDDVNKTPSFGRANKFFGIPLTDSANNSPRLGVRITRKSPLERTEFASENLDGTVVDGGNGDPILYSLKRQVRLDRKSLMALYMELDEERSASAVAANNAMAMITRLQAEKAAMQMEALQYQRMMEEQAEYDQEALQATNELLVKREEEIKALESELAAFREKYGYLKEFELKKSENDSDEENQETKSQSYLSCSTLLGINGKGIKDRSNNFDDQAVSIEEKSEGGVLDDSLKIVKDEKSYLRVKKVEKKSPISSDDGVHSVQSTSDSTNDGDEEIGEESKISLTGALYHLSEKVKALEADTGFLEHAAQIHEKHGEGTKILTEISRNLQKLQNLIAMPFEDIDA